MKIKSQSVKSLKDSCLLIKRPIKKNRNKVKEQRAWFPGILEDTLRESLLGNLFTDKGLIKAC